MEGYYCLLFSLFVFSNVFYFTYYLCSNKYLQFAGVFGGGGIFPQVNEVN